MAIIKRFVGGAGSGKTTKMMSYIQDEYNNGVKLSDICFTSFSQAQRNDVRKRIGDIYIDATNKEITEQVKTIHGAALRACILNEKISIKDGDKIVDENYYFKRGENPFANFAKNVGLKYYPNEADPLTLLESDDTNRLHLLPSGNVFFTISRYLKSNMMEQSEWGIVSDLLNYTFKQRLDYTIEELLGMWDFYKFKKKIWEHDDYVRFVIDAKIPPYTQVLFFDEYQDVSPSQHELFKFWSNHNIVKRAYIAGDPNQSIYGFRGASPSYIRVIDAIDDGAWSGNGMPQSYRCPKVVIDYADRVLHGLSNMSPSTHDGNVKQIDIEDEVAYVKQIIDNVDKYNTVMILSRYTTYISDIYNMLNKYGVPYSGLTGKRVWWWDKSNIFIDGKKTDASVKIQDLLDAFRKIKKYYDDGYTFGEHVIFTNKETVALCVAYTGEKWTSIMEQFKSAQVKIIGYKGVYSIEKVLLILNNISEFDDDMDMLFLNLLLPKDISENISNTILNNININPNQLIVDTIHASKGLEAQCVMVDSSYSETKQKECMENMQMLEEERRIYYVAFTRAKKELQLVRNKTNPISPPMMDVLD